MAAGLPSLSRCDARAYLLILSSAVLLGAGCGRQSRKADVTALSPSNVDAQFEKGADLPPTEKTILAAARVLAAQQREAECEFVLTSVIREHPRFMPAYCDLAELQMRHRRIDDAIQTLSVVLRSSPRDPVLLNNLGMCRLIKCDYEDALRAFTRAAAAVPHDSRYRANMAVALGMMGRYEESLSLYEQILSPEEAQHNLGVLYKARGRLLEESPAAQQRAGQATISDGGSCLTIQTTHGEPADE